MFSNPTGTDYSRFEIKLQKSAAGLIKEWVDTILFAAYEDVPVESTGKAYATGRRRLHAARTAAWDAKTRRPGMPPEMELSYTAYDAARKGIDNATQ